MLIYITFELYLFLNFALHISWYLLLFIQLVTKGTLHALISKKNLTLILFCCWKPDNTYSCNVYLYGIMCPVSGPHSKWFPHAWRPYLRRLPGGLDCFRNYSMFNGMSFTHRRGRRLGEFTLKNRAKYSICIHRFCVYLTWAFITVWSRMLINRDAAQRLELRENMFCLNLKNSRVNIRARGFLFVILPQGSLKV